MFSRFLLPMVHQFYALTEKESAKYRKLGYINPEKMVRTAGCVAICNELGISITGNAYDELLTSVRKVWTEDEKDFIIFKIYKRRDIEKAYIGVTIQSDFTLELWDKKY